LHDKVTRQNPSLTPKKPPFVGSTRSHEFVRLSRNRENPSTQRGGLQRRGNLTPWCVQQLTGPAPSWCRSGQCPVTKKSSGRGGDRGYPNNAHRGSERTDGADENGKKTRHPVNKFGQDLGTFNLITPDNVHSGSARKSQGPIPELDGNRVESLGGDKEMPNRGIGKWSLPGDRQHCNGHKCLNVQAGCKNGKDGPTGEKCKRHPKKVTFLSEQSAVIFSQTEPLPYETRLKPGCQPYLPATFNTALRQCVSQMFGVFGKTGPKFCRTGQKKRSANEKRPGTANANSRRNRVMGTNSHGLPEGRHQRSPMTEKKKNHCSARIQGRKNPPWANRPAVLRSDTKKRSRQAINGSPHKRGIKDNHGKQKKGKKQRKPGPGVIYSAKRDVSVMKTTQEKKRCSNVTQGLAVHKCAKKNVKKTGKKESKKKFPEFVTRRKKKHEISSCETNNLKVEVVKKRESSPNGSNDKESRCDLRKGLLAWSAVGPVLQGGTRPRRIKPSLGGRVNLSATFL